MSQISDLVEVVNKLADRMGSQEKAIAALKAPATGGKGLTPEQVVAMLQGQAGKALVGTDGSWFSPPSAGMGRVLERGVGMGTALKAIYDRHKHNIGNDEAIEREHGFMTLDRFKEVGHKRADGVVRKAALAEGSGITGGYVVPPQFASTLLRLAIEEAIVRRFATVLPMTSRTLQVPTLDVTTAQTAGTTPFLGGILASWQPEAASINESEPTFRQMELVAWDLVFHTIASNQLLADNAVALDALLTQLFKEALAWYSDYAFLRGTGTASSMPLGILNAPATIQFTRTTAAKFQLPDVAGMMSRILVKSWDSVVWIMHPSVLPQVLQLKDDSGGAGVGRLVFINPAPPTVEGGIANKMPMSILGRPIFWTEKLPALGTTGCVLLADLSYYLVGDRMELQIDVSPHVKFLTNQMVWRIIARMDGKPWLNGPVTYADGTYTASPFVTITQ